MLTRLYADNYRCFTNFEIFFEPLSVLLGPNGAGKSASLLLIAKIRDFVLGRSDAKRLFPSRSSTRWDQRSVMTVELGVRLEYGEYLYRARFENAATRTRRRIIEEQLLLDGNTLFQTVEGRTLLYNDRFGGGVEFQPDPVISGLSRVDERHDNTKLTAFRRFLENTIVLAIYPAGISSVADPEESVMLPETDGSDFAEWLSYLIGADALVRQRAEQNLAAGSLPGFRAFQAPPFGENRIIECLFASQGPKPTSYRLSEMSDGQLALIILEIALAYVTEHGGSLLLDEPGNFLGLSEINPLLNRLLDNSSEGMYQAILSAHHPIAIDFLAAAHGQWLDREPGGPTRAQRLHVSSELTEENPGLRISDLVARGWLSGLGVQAVQAATSASRPN